MKPSKTCRPSSTPARPFWPMGRRHRGRTRQRPRRGQHLHPQAAHPLPMGGLRLARDQIRAKQNLLRDGLRNSGFKLTWVKPEVHLPRSLAFPRRPPHCGRSSSAPGSSAPSSTPGRSITTIERWVQAFCRLRPRPRLLQPPRPRHRMKFFPGSTSAPGCAATT